MWCTATAWSRQFPGSLDCDIFDHCLPWISEHTGYRQSACTDYDDDWTRHGAGRVWQSDASQTGAEVDQRGPQSGRPPPEEPGTTSATGGTVGVGGGGEGSLLPAAHAVHGRLPVESQRTARDSGAEGSCSATTPAMPYTGGARQATQTANTDSQMEVDDLRYWDSVIVGGLPEQEDADIQRILTTAAAAGPTTLASEDRNRVQDWLNRHKTLSGAYFPVQDLCLNLVYRTPSFREPLPVRCYLVRVRTLGSSSGQGFGSGTLHPTTPVRSTQSCSRTRLVLLLFASLLTSSGQANRPRGYSAKRAALKQSALSASATASVQRLVLRTKRPPTARRQPSARGRSGSDGLIEGSGLTLCKLCIWVADPLPGQAFVVLPHPSSTRAARAAGSFVPAFAKYLACYSAFCLNCCPLGSFGCCGLLFSPPPYGDPRPPCCSARLMSPALSATAFRHCGPIFMPGVMPVGFVSSCSSHAAGRPAEPFCRSRSSLTLWAFLGSPIRISFGVLLVEVTVSPCGLMLITESSALNSIESPALRPETGFLLSPDLLTRCRFGVCCRALFEEALGFARPAVCHRMHIESHGGRQSWSPQSLTQDSVFCWMHAHGWPLWESFLRSLLLLSLMSFLRLLWTGIGFAPRQPRRNALSRKGRISLRGAPLAFALAFTLPVVGAMQSHDAMRLPASAGSTESSPATSSGAVSGGDVPFVFGHPLPSPAEPSMPSPTACSGPPTYYRGHGRSACSA